MGAISAMSSISRVIEAHGDEISQEYALMVPASIRDKFQEISLVNNVHALEIEWLFGAGESLPGPSIGIDQLAKQFPDCAVGY